MSIYISTNKLQEKKQIKTYSDYVCLIWAAWLIISSGAIAVWYNMGRATILLNLIWAAYFAIKVRKIRVNKKRDLLFLFMLAVIGVHYFVLGFTGYNNSGALHIISIIVMIYMGGLVCNKETFLNCFTKIVTILAIVSLAVFAMYPVITSMRAVLPTLTLTNGVYSSHYTNLYICLVKWEGSQRNCSIFWEPGAYQIFLNISLFYLLFMEHKKQSMLQLGIICLTIVTTISTVGISIMLVLICAYIMQKKKKGKATNGLMIILLIVAFVFMFYDAIMGSIVYKFGLETGVATSNLTSRTEPFLLDLQLMIENPFGVGPDKYAIKLEELKIAKGLIFESSSCTPTIIGAMLGFYVTLVIVYGYWKNTRRVTQTKGAAILLMVACILLFSSESFILYPIFYYFVLMNIFENSIPLHKGIMLN